MLDAAKYADLVLLLIDGSFGFEMETFEFLNLLQVPPFLPCTFLNIPLRVSALSAKPSRKHRSC